MKTVATRFAPSPTGPLHIGGVRTALFNWLYSKNKGGKFYLRIEDTDKERSKDEFKNQIINSLKWIGIYYEDNEYIQSDRINDHINVANELLKKAPLVAVSLNASATVSAVVAINENASFVNSTKLLKVFLVSSSNCSLNSCGLL